GGREPPAECLPSESAPATARARTAIAATAATAAAGSALWLRTRLVDDEVAIAEEPAVQHLDCLGRFFLRGHLDEPKAAWPTRELVGDDADGLDRPRLREQLPQIFFGGLEREVADKQFRGHRGLLTLSPDKRRNLEARLQIPGGARRD